MFTVGLMLSCALYSAHTQKQYGCKGREETDSLQKADGERIQQQRAGNICSHIFTACVEEREQKKYYKRNILG